MRSGLLSHLKFARVFSLDIWDASDGRKTVLKDSIAVWQNGNGTVTSHPDRFEGVTSVAGIHRIVTDAAAEGRIVRVPDGMAQGYSPVMARA